jgi:hypothetical protein
VQQLQSGVFFYVTRIRDRRFVAIDRERGVAFAFAFFDNASGDARNGTLRDGRKVSSGPSIPWTWQIAEFFKIERADRSRRIGAAPRPLRHGLGLEHLGRRDVQPASLTIIPRCR